MASDPSGSSRRCWPFSTTSPAVLRYSIPGSRRGLADPGCISKICLSPKRRAERGVGRRLMTRLAAIAVERGWERIDFQVLDWNPARDFYRRLGIEHLGAWLRYGGDAAALPPTCRRGFARPRLTPAD